MNSKKNIFYKSFKKTEPHVKVGLTSKFYKMEVWKTSKLSSTHKQIKQETPTQIQEKQPQMNSKKKTKKSELYKSFKKVTNFTWYNLEADQKKINTTKGKQVQITPFTAVFFFLSKVEENPYQEL